MVLFIDTTQNNLVEIGVRDKNKFIARKRFKSDHTQAEKLLPGIVKMLAENKLKLSDLQAIKAVNRGGSFTSLRVGVVTANALGYALGRPVTGSEIADVPKRPGPAGKSGHLKFSLIEPLYDRQPEITKARRRAV